MGQYLTLLRHNANYRNLWLGYVISLLGDWFNLLASAELITELTSGGIALSYLFLARFLPLFAFSPLAGVLADRYSRRSIMIASDVLRAVTVLGFLFIRSPDQVWLFYVLTITQFSLSALFTPARTAVLANVVAPRELVTANALDSLTWSTMLALGAFLGGLVAAIFGAEAAFIADALTFLLSAWFIARVYVAVSDRDRETAATGGWLQFIDGLRYLLGQPIIFGVALAKAGGALVWGAINVVEVTYAENLFPLPDTAWTRALSIEDGGTASLGLIWVMSGLGTGIGPLVVRRWLGDRPPRLMTGVSLGFAMLAVGIGLLSVAPTLPATLAATLVRTVGSGTVWVFSAAFLQMTVPDRYRGRVFAFEFAMMTLLQSVSIYTAGYLQDTAGVGIRETAAVFAVLGTVVGAAWLAFHLGSRTWVQRQAILNQ